jgi:hypothetical protein
MSLLYAGPCWQQEGPLKKALAQSGENGSLDHWIMQQLIKQWLVVSRVFPEGCILEEFFRDLLFRTSVPVAVEITCRLPLIFMTNQ